jgi:hypothetical protein
LIFKHSGRVPEEKAELVALMQELQAKLDKQVRDPMRCEECHKKLLPLFPQNDSVACSLCLKGVQSRQAFLEQQCRHRADYNQQCAEHVQVVYS